MRTARWIITLIALVIAAGSPGSGVGAASINWKSLPYLNYNSQRMEIYTNGSWDGAKLVKNPFDYPSVNAKLIWAPNCGAKPQLVAFRKYIEAYGEPYQGSVELAYSPGYDRPYVAAEFLVNGVVIARLGNTANKPLGHQGKLVFDGPLTDSGLTAFQYGTNKLTILVWKAALKKGQKCVDASRAVNRFVGISGFLTLQFGATLSADQKPGFLVQKNVGSGGFAALTVMGDIIFRNAGPAASLAGYVHFTVTGGSQHIKTMILRNFIPSVAIPPLLPCTYDPPEVTLYLHDVMCRYQDFRERSVAHIVIFVGAYADSGFPANGVDRETISWGINSDLAGSDKIGAATASKDFVICGPKATGPICQSQLTGRSVTPRRPMVQPSFLEGGVVSSGPPYGCLTHRV